MFAKEIADSLGIPLWVHLAAIAATSLFFFVRKREKFQLGLWWHFGWALAAAMNASLPWYYALGLAIVNMVLVHFYFCLALDLFHKKTGK